jgi:hypothetical protein
MGSDFKLMYCICQRWKRKFRQDKIIQLSDACFKALVEEGCYMISLARLGELQIYKSTNQVVLGIDPKDYIGKMLSIHPSGR